MAESAAKISSSSDGNDQRDQVCDEMYTCMYVCIYVDIYECRYGMYGRASDIKIVLCYYYR